MRWIAVVGPVCVNGRGRWESPRLGLLSESAQSMKQRECDEKQEDIETLATIQTCELAAGTVSTDPAHSSMCSEQPGPHLLNSLATCPIRTAKGISSAAYTSLALG